jgi:hypothetical protein
LEKGYEMAELNANISFRSILGENGLTAKDAVHILNGMLVEWQREATMQTFADMVNKEAEKANSEIEEQNQQGQ